MIWQRSFIVLFILSLASFHAKATSLLILGDSLSAGYNMKAEESWQPYYQAYYQRLIAPLQ